MRMLTMAGALLLLPSALRAQALAQQIQGAGDGTVRLSFAARAGVCGSSHGVTVMDGGHDDDWVGDCERGPVRVSLRMRSGMVSDATTRVAGHWRPGNDRVTDLGIVPAREAADAMLALARRAAEDAGDELITAATLADSAEVWPELLRMARDGG